METTVKLSIEDRIEFVAIAYVQSHYDVKNMTLLQFVEAVNTAENQLTSAIGKK